VHVVADGASLCTELRRLPANVTLTGPLRSNASLWHTHPDLDHPPRLRARGRPPTYAARIGTPTDLAATTPSTPVTAPATHAPPPSRCTTSDAYGAACSAPARSGCW
jgi:hypothetical protein